MMVHPAAGGFLQKLLFLLPLTFDSSFNYDDPHQWYINFPQCLGFQQSPIDIYSQKVITAKIPPIVFGYYNAFLADVIHMHNNGHAIEFSVPGTVLGERPFISGAWLRDLYEVASVHFHWGSEHMINGERYDLEMHIVHKNVQYVNLEVARDFEDGLVVLAVLFKVVKSPNVFYPGLNQVYNTLENLVAFNSTVNTNIITLDSLLADLNRDDFFTYKGSLTTPPCSESVTWFVFSDPLPISFRVLPKFWQVLDSRGLVLKKNFRPSQPIGYRKIYHRQPHLKYGFYSNSI